MSGSFTLDGRVIPFQAGQTLLQAALAAGIDLPHLCFLPGLPVHGSCRVCTVIVAGRALPACSTPASDGMVVDGDGPEVRALRLAVVRMLFVEGNHSCPSCLKTGDCRLQSVASQVGMDTPRYAHLHPARAIDASHPAFLLDYNRCILCSLCVRASRDVDRKNVFGLSGRGSATTLVVNAESGRLGDTDFAATDLAARVCPVGALLPRQRPLPAADAPGVDPPGGARGQA